MTAGIKTQAGEVILFSAITNRSESYSGRVTSHPIESGSKISDHIIVNNPSFSVDGVITYVDFGGVAIRIGTEGTEDDKLTLSVIEAYNNTVPKVTIDTSQPSRFASLIPESVAAFINDDKPKISVADSQAVSLKVTKDKLIALKDKSELVQIFFMEGSIVTEVVDDCFITSLAFSETTDSGEALYVSMAFEKVQVVTLDSSVVPALTWREIRTAAAPTTKKGKKDKGSGTAPDDVPPDTPAPVADMTRCKLDFAEGREGTTTECWIDSSTAGSGSYVP